MAEMALSLMPSNADIMKAFKGMEKWVSVKIDEVLSAVMEIEKRMTEVEERISGAEDEIVQLKTRANSLEAEVKTLECWSRRNNLRLVGLPEKEEGMDTCTFLEKWLPEILEMDPSTPPLIIERAHRIHSSSQGHRRRDGKAPPRTLIMKFLNFKQKELVLKVARAKGIIKY